jgi:hypothetical protein
MGAQNRIEGSCMLSTKLRPPPTCAAAAPLCLTSWPTNCEAGLLLVQHPAPGPNAIVAATGPSHGSCCQPYAEL